MIAILLDVFYLFAVLLLSPLLLYRIYVRGKYKDTLGERLGCVSHLPALTECIWVHGVSVGEIKAAKPLVERLKQQLPAVPILVSATSAAGKKMAAALYPDCRIISFPLDFSWSVRAFLRRFHPRLIVLMELEMWPNFLLQARRMDVPVVLVNGRLSERSFRGYRRYLGLFFSHLTAGVRHFSMQTEVYADRLMQLGVKPERITVAGNMKFDAIVPQKWLDRQPHLEKMLGLLPSMQVWLAGSTHAPEEKILLDCHVELRRQFPQLRLILVPRHPERANEVAQWVRQHDLLAVKKSEIAEGYIFQENHVVIGDRMGELAELYTVCNIAFIGGSLIPHGGQNFIEPASLGKAVVCGPCMHNFPEIRLFLDQQAIVQLPVNEALPAIMASLLQDANRRQQLGERARSLVYHSQGSAERNCQLCLANM